MRNEEWQKMSANNPSHIEGVGFDYITFNVKWGKFYFNKEFLHQLAGEIPPYVLVYVNQDKDKVKFNFINHYTSDAYSITQEGGGYCSIKKLARLIKESLDLPLGRNKYRLKIEKADTERNTIYLDLDEDNLVEKDYNRYKPKGMTYPIMSVDELEDNK